MPIIMAATALAVVVPLAATRYTPSARSQVVGPPTTPQPTVSCTPSPRAGGGGCGKGPGVKRDVAFAWIDRYCSGGVVVVPPGETQFAVNYGLGGQASGAVQFFGVATANGATIPTSPLDVLQPGQKDSRVRAAVVPDGVIFQVTLTGTYVSGPNAGQAVLFGNGSTTRIRFASGTCPAVTPQTPASSPPPTQFPPLVPTTPATTAPPVNTVPGTGTIVPTK